MEETTATKPKKKIKLTKKQRGFVKDYAVNENGTQAALKNYNINGKHGTKNPLKVAEVIGSENLSKPIIREAIEEERITLRKALKDKGITEEKIADKIDVLLEAKKPIYEENSDGKFEHVGDEIDFTAVDKGLKHATAIYGIEEDKPKPHQQTYNFFFNSEVQGEVKIMEEKIKNLLIKPNASTP